MTNIATRQGKSIYGAPLGILMLEARFPRDSRRHGQPRSDTGTWPFPVLYRVVRGATPERGVLQGAAGPLPDFLAAAADLVDLGAEAITTNCGLSVAVSTRTRRPCAGPRRDQCADPGPTGSRPTLPPGNVRVGVITVSAGSLTPRHLEAAGVPLDTPIVGTESGREFFPRADQGRKSRTWTSISRGTGHPRCRAAP